MVRAFDFIVFGASGFTGLRVAKYIFNTPALKDLKVAIAGRSQSKLDVVNTTIGSNFAAIVADVKDESSMLNMCNQGTIVLNCVGPYRFFGEPVVKACIDAGTHYVDISGEPEFIERMELTYHQQAKDKNLVIVSACGFDSIPADMGTAFTVAQFPSGAKIGNVQSYLSLKSGDAGMAVHYTTYECAVHGFGSQEDLKEVRKQQPSVKIPSFGPRAPKSALPRWHAPVDAYALPFPGSDASIVRRSQRALITSNSEVQPVPYSAFFTIPSTLWTSVFVAMGTVFGALASFNWGRSLLLSNPKTFTLGLFSHEGPTEEQMAQASFEMKFFAQGFSAGLDPAQAKPDINVNTPANPLHCYAVCTSVAGPEPGYIATPIFLVNSARTILEQASQLPKGVLTTATAFRDSNLVERLEAAGIKFTVHSS